MSESLKALQERIELLITQLEVHGAKALACDTCRRVGLFGVHGMHELLVEALFVLREQEGRERAGDTEGDQKLTYVDTPGHSTGEATGGTD